MSEEKPPLLEIEAPPAPVWLRRTVALLFVPLLLTGGNPLLGLMLGIAMAQSLPNVPPAVAMLMGVGVITTPTLAAMLVLYHHHIQYRSALLDERGVVFGRTPKWPGTRMRWEEIAGYGITGDGIMLRLRGKPWTRWLGPVIKSRDRLTHEVVLKLEEQGLARLDG